MHKNHYLYFKNGDAVDQVARVLDNSSITINSGPDAFIWDFFHQITGSRVTVLSRSQRNARMSSGLVDAQVYDKGKGIFERIIRLPIIFLRILGRILILRPTHILCGTTGSTLWACIVSARFLRVPFVYSGHNRLELDSEHLYRRLIANMDKWCVKRADAVICHGPYLRDQLLRMGVKDRNLFEFDVGFGDMLSDSRKPLAEQYIALVEEYTVILFIGRIEQDKGIYDLLEACAEQLMRNKRLRLVYAGSGSQLGKLKMEIERRSLVNEVILLGVVSHSNLGPLMKRSYFLVTPTRGEFPEGRCMAAMEGMVMGLPVIAPDFGPFPYIVNHEKNGLLFRTGSVEDLRKCIDRLLDDSIFYIKMKIGAEKSGSDMVHPPLSFGRAVLAAFKEPMSDH